MAQVLEQVKKLYDAFYRCLRCGTPLNQNFCLPEPKLCAHCAMISELYGEIVA